MSYKNLDEIVRDRMSELSLSTYDVARRSGDKINANTITRILNGDVKEAKLSTLEAIATALELPLDDLIRAALGREAPPERFKIYAERFDGEDLSETEWQYLERYFHDAVAVYKQHRKRLEADFAAKMNEKD